MDAAMKTLPPTLYPGLYHHPHVKRTLVYQHSLLKRMQRDMTFFVAESATTDNRRLLLDRPTAGVREEVLKREFSIEEWKAKKFPFAYADGVHEALNVFLADVVAVQGSFLQGKVELAELAKRIIKMGRRPTGTPPKYAAVTAPAVPKGTFIHAIRYAVPLIHTEYALVLAEAKRKRAEMVSFQEFFAAGLRVALDRLSILFIPWNLERAGGPGSGRGRVSQRMAHTAWVTVAPIPPGAFSFMRLMNREHPLSPAQLSVVAERADPNAPWRFSQLRLQDLHLYLDKAHPPGEFDLRTVQVGPEMDDDEADEGKEKLFNSTYRWSTTDGTWDMGNRVHRLFVILGIFFGRAAPRVGWNDKDKGYVNLDDQTSVNASVRSRPWVYPTGSKGASGMNNASEMAFMMSTFMLSLYKRDSPVRRYHDRTRALGKFGSDHSEFLRYWISWSASDSVLPGKKGISGFNLVRLRVAYARASIAIYGSPHFNRDYYIRKDDKLLEIADDVERLLRDQANYGPYAMVTKYFDEGTAWRMHDDQQLDAPPEAINRRKAEEMRLQEQGAGKRTRADEDASGDELRSPASRRRRDRVYV